MNTDRDADTAAVWVGQLLRRYNHVTANSQSLDSEQIEALNTLQLADAVLEKLAFTESNPKHCLQLAIVGPTQSGKSTLVNVLLDCVAASVSALAGFTVHAQGYAAGVSEADLDAMHTLMEPMRRTPAAQLDATDLDAYVLESVRGGDAAALDNTVVWDTPDFDSIESGSYRRAVIQTMGLADVLILMVSKDKYGDKSVWDMLALLHELQQPLLVCINKLDKADEQTVLNAFTQRYREQLDSSVPPIVMLPFIRKINGEERITLPAAARHHLIDELNVAEQKVDRQKLKHIITNFVTRHRQQWLSPLLIEKRAQAQWISMVDTIVVDAEKRYEEGYLNNPDKYDTFNRALAELLTLLEIPGLAPALARSRQLVTWPARKLLGIGRSVLDKRMSSSQQRSTSDHAPDQEADTLKGILDNALITLQGELLDQAQEPYWRAMNQALRQQESRIRETYMAQSSLARKEFEPQIEVAAQRLYEQLQAQPALLNTLRATRVTADAAGVALALKSGGLAPADLILAPAMFSVTTLLTESALGKYLDSIKRELKEQQGRHINERVLRDVLGKELGQLSENLDSSGLYLNQLEPELDQVLTQQSRESVH